MNWDDYTEITTPADADTFLNHDVSETVVGQKMKKITWANIKATLKTYFDTLYLAITNKAAGTDLDTATDDSKYITSKAVKDSHNVPSVAPGTSGNVLTSNGTAWTSAAAAGGGASTPPGRLTLESGVPVSTTDQVDKTTLYYTPYVGNQIMLYSGTAWETKTFAELSLNISAFTASKPYDIWVYNNAGTVTLDSTVWTNATTRATALAYQDGRLVKSGAATRLYLGTIYMDAASKCQDTMRKRFVYNYYNKRHKKLLNIVAAGSWTYTLTTWRQANGDANNKVEIINGFLDSEINLNNMIPFQNQTAGKFGIIAIGEDQITAPSSDIYSFQSDSGTSGISSSTSVLTKIPPIGYHYYAMLERADTPATIAFYGTNSGVYQSGMIGYIDG